jgi:hypothetical protein
LTLIEGVVGCRQTTLFRGYVHQTRAAYITKKISFFARACARVKNLLPKLAFGGALAYLSLLSVSNVFALSNFRVADGTLGKGTARNVVFHKGYGYWVFYTDNVNSEMVYRFSADGTSFGSATSVFPNSSLSTDAGYGSVWYVAASSRVYVAVQETGSDVTASPWNKVYARRGQLNSDGTITWEAIRTLNPTDIIGGAAGDAYPASLTASIVVSSDDTLGQVYIGADGKKDSGNAANLRRTGGVGSIQLAANGRRGKHSGSGFDPRKQHVRIEHDLF